MFRHTILQSKDYSRRLLATRTAEFVKPEQVNPLIASPYKQKKTTPPKQQPINVSEGDSSTKSKPKKTKTSTKKEQPKIPRESLVTPEQIFAKQKKTTPPKQQPINVSEVYSSTKSKPKKTKTSTKKEQPKIPRESLVTPEQIFASELPAPAPAPEPELKPKAKNGARKATVLPSVNHNSSIGAHLAPEAQHSLYALFCYRILADYGFNLNTTDVRDSGAAMMGKWYLPNKAVNVYGTCMHTTQVSKSLKQKGGTHKDKQRDTSDGVKLIINNTGFQSVVGQEFTTSSQPTIICSIFDRSSDWLSMKQSNGSTIRLNKNLHKQLWNQQGILISPARWKLEKNTECPFNQLTQGISLLIFNNAFNDAYPEISAGKVVYQRAKENQTRKTVPSYAASTFLLHDATLEDERQDLATFVRNEKRQQAELLLKLEREEEERMRSLLEAESAKEFDMIREEENRMAMFCEDEQFVEELDQRQHVAEHRELDHTTENTEVYDHNHYLTELEMGHEENLLNQDDIFEKERLSLLRMLESTSISEDSLLDEYDIGGPCSEPVTIDDVLEDIREHGYGYMNPVEESSRMFQIQTRSLYTLTDKPAHKNMAVTLYQQEKASTELSQENISTELNQEKDQSDDLLEQERLFMIELLEDKMEKESKPYPRAGSTQEEETLKPSHGRVMNPVFLEDTFDQNYYEANRVMDIFKTSPIYRMRKFLLDKLNCQDVEQQMIHRYCMAREPEHNKPLQFGVGMPSEMPSLPKHRSFARIRRSRPVKVEPRESRDFVEAPVQEECFRRRLSENRFVV